MTYVNLVSGTILSALLISAHVNANEQFPKLQGPWFGQNVPGSTPELFAPGLVSLEGRYEFGMSFLHILAHRDHIFW